MDTLLHRKQTSSVGLLSLNMAVQSPMMMNVLVDRIRQLFQKTKKYTKPYWETVKISETRVNTILYKHLPMRKLCPEKQQPSQWFGAKRGSAAILQNHIVNHLNGQQLLKALIRRISSSTYYILWMKKLRKNAAKCKIIKDAVSPRCELCHKPLATMAKLHKLKFELPSYLPYSPDLAPSDYLFADPKIMFHEKMLGSNAEVIAAAKTYFKSKDKSFPKKPSNRRVVTLEWHNIDE